MSEAAAHLLIVDDNRVNRLLLSRSVELLGYTATVAENGHEAMDMLRARVFDLMLLDIEMPVMDGFEVLEAIKLEPALKDIPIIVTSSVEGVNNIVRCIDLGAEDYLPKPVNPVLLRARLSSSLEKKRLRDEQKTLLKRFATSEVVQDLQESGFKLGGRRVHATILFCDIRGFTTISERQSPEDTIEMLNIYYTLMFEAIDHHNGIVTLMIGDGLMVLFGAPQPLENSAASAVAAAQDMLAIIELFNLEQAAAEKPEIRLGIGIATGEVVAGYAGTKDRATYTCIGDKVNLASRLEGHTKRVSRPILIDEATHSAVSASQPCDPIGQVELDGFSKPVAVFAVGRSV
ncbi:adenylate/guanylate cyclase domain-containing protein [Tateyamaria pelophila]|uniref:adenylate/guanylate cyclase domain-containing protein n=1 Tax=Tateyamaria pelophila TaxID=328415 RepID=UPI001CBCE8B6|nr:adenylate/guanylate cyclase domain-containing protein [Tateyamaria pelophila]